MLSDIVCNINTVVLCLMNSHRPITITAPPCFTLTLVIYLFSLFSLRKIQKTGGKKLHLCNNRLHSYKYDNILQNAGEVRQGNVEVGNVVLNLYKSDQIDVAMKR